MVSRGKETDHSDLAPRPVNVTMAQNMQGRPVFGSRAHGSNEKDGEGMIGRWGGNPAHGRFLNPVPFTAY
jgi:hypothetical protein